MKILVFADFHGSVASMQDAVQISKREQPDKTVVCGDLFGWNSPSQIVAVAQELQGVLYFVRGNNDWATDTALLPCGFEDNAVMYCFGRKLFFTHGDRYNGMAIPPVLSEGDALIYGHSHMGRLRVKDGLFLLNVGSLARPRDGVPCYLVLDEQGASLRSPDGEVLSQLQWNN